MSAVWYDAIAGERAEPLCWELYHENSKTSRPRSFSRAEAPKSAGAAARLPGATVRNLLAGVRGATETSDPTELLIHTSNVDGIPFGLYRHTLSGPELVRRGDLGQPLADALAATSPSAVQLFIVGNFASVISLGERSYRVALMAAGALIHELKRASAADIALREVAYYDRELDALLGLDGLTRSVLAVLTVGPAKQG